MEKARVLFFVSTLERSGPTNVIFNIVKYIDRNKVEPIVLTLSPEPASSRKEDFEGLGVEVHSFQANRVKWLFSTSSLQKLVQKLDPSLIHSHSYRADVTSAHKLKNFRRVSTVHGDLQANYRNTYNTLLATLMANRQINSVAHLERAIACSYSVYNLYKTKVHHLECIPNGVDHELFVPASVEEQKTLREKLEIPKAKIVFVTVGSLCLRKDPETVIEGFIGSDGNTDGVLLVVGTGSLEMRLRERYSSNSNIIFVGFTDNVSQYLKAADIFISASHSEGLPNTVLEALACGLPVCLSDIPSHREIVQDHRFAGRIFSIGKREMLSQEINNLLRGLLHEQKKEARQIVDERYSAGLMAKRYQDLYLKLTNG